MTKRAIKTAAVIPAYKTKDLVASVVRESSRIFDHVFVVDDACPQQTGRHAEQQSRRLRNVTVIYNKTNMGVGGATKVGMREAILRNFEVIVKVDSDGQMDLGQIDRLLLPINQDKADFSKGNRLTSVEDLVQMPRLRVVGNSLLTLMSRASTGLWQISDPTNGYIAVKSSLLRRINLDKVSNDYRFESDLLFRVAIAEGRVQDVPMAAIYGREISSLKPFRVGKQLLGMHFKNFVKRIAYQYFVFEINVGTLYLLSSSILTSFGLVFGLSNWILLSQLGEFASPGTAIIAATSLILGVQLGLQFLSFDISKARNAS